MHRDVDSVPVGLLCGEVSGVLIRVCRWDSVGSQTEVPSGAHHRP